MIHPHTYIHPNAKLAWNVKVEPFTTIHPDTQIDEGVWIGSNVTIMDGVRIGKHCKIFPGAVIGCIPQDLKFEGEFSEVFIGDNTTIREFVTINRGTKASGKTVIKNDALIMAYTHIAHDCVIGNKCVIANNTQIAGHVLVDDYAIIGGMAGIHQFAHVGQHAFVSANTFVDKDIPPYTKVGRMPVSYAGINSVGLRRRNFSTEKINEILEIYRWIYSRGLDVASAVEHINLELPATNERDIIIQFIELSMRGIVRRSSLTEAD